MEDYCHRLFGPDRQKKDQRTGGLYELKTGVLHLLTIENVSGYLAVVFYDAKGKELFIRFVSK